MSVAPLPTPTFGGGYDGEARPRMGFFTEARLYLRDEADGLRRG
jgi:hypothetical protein